MTFFRPCSTFRLIHSDTFRFVIISFRLLLFSQKLLCDLIWSGNTCFCFLLLVPGRVIKSDLTSLFLLFQKEWNWRFELLVAHDVAIFFLLPNICQQLSLTPSSPLFPTDIVFLLLAFCFLLFLSASSVLYQLFRSFCFQTEKKTKKTTRINRSNSECGHNRSSLTPPDDTWFYAVDKSCIIHPDCSLILWNAFMIYLKMFSFLMFTAS